MDGVTISGLFIYPVKGCRGVAVREAEVTDRGFALDRRWMVTDARGRFLSQRVHPRLALVEVEVVGDSLVAKAPGTEPLKVPLVGRAGGKREVDIWDDTVVAWSEGPAAAAWFGRVLSLECDLVRMPDTTRRQVDPARARPGDLVGFADAYPFLLLSEGSLGELNRRLASPVPIDRFRPNIVVAGCPPHAEDGWRTLAAGGVSFRMAKPCARCIVTTVDQSTGVRAEEPLRTLATYRQRGNEVLFGQNLVHDGRGVVRLGDSCRVSPA
ncbi:MAG: MOSC domain-containing protein [Acidobacteriota bacterium]